MRSDNVIEKKSPKEIDALKNRLSKSKCARMEMIDGFIDKLRVELESRDLTEVPTPVLSRMLVSFADLAKKEQPLIELRYGTEDYGWAKERVTF